MAKRFTRNVKDVKDVTKFGIIHTTQNDLINDDKNVFVHQKGKFEKITHQIDTLSSNGSVTIGEKDDKDNVHLSVYTGYVDEITSSDESLIVGEKTNGTVNVEVDYAPIDEKIQVANSQLEEQVIEADTQLATNLATEVADRQSADNAIQTQIDNLSIVNTYYFAYLNYKYEDDNEIIIGYMYFRYDKSTEDSLGNLEEVRKFFEDNMDIYIECTGFLKITNKENNTISTKQVSLIDNKFTNFIFLECFDIMTNTFERYHLDENAEICELSISHVDNRTPYYQS